MNMHEYAVHHISRSCSQAFQVVDYLSRRDAESAGTVARTKLMLSALKIYSAVGGQLPPLQVRQLAYNSAGLAAAAAAAYGILRSHHLPDADQLSWRLPQHYLGTLLEFSLYAGLDVLKLL